METDHTFEWAVQRHDERIAALGLPIWVGSEPTFTDREAQTPPWLNAALGEDKEQRAQILINQLAGLMPGGLLLRSVGRLYPGEKLPRWNLGLLRLRNGTPVWRGPPDPMQALQPIGPITPLDLSAWASALAGAFGQQGWSVDCTQATQEDSGPAWQLTAKIHPDDGKPLHFLITAFEPVAAPDATLVNCAGIELPAIEEVMLFLVALSCIERTALACGLQALVFTGANPPVDDTVELTTVTPDPAVVEINSAPSQNCAEFLWRSQQVYAAAAAQKLSPYRLYFNGQVADSGGAGQITFGGPAPETSPFVRHPQLLPKLVRFLNRHPALSYHFAHDFVGGSGQSVRPDERGADAFDDLVLALSLLEREPDVSPELLWKSLSSFLCDTVGNSHRAEINIEKLWNPFLPGRGRLGLVEFRSLRMQHTPQRATAIACLFRAVLARLASYPYDLPLIDWGRELHDRFALPFYLNADLDEVFAELDNADLGLDEPLKEVLRQNGFRFFGKVDLPFGELELWRGLEFWPLVGDAASSAQNGSSRTVDASTTRIEVRWRPPAHVQAEDSPLGNWLEWQLQLGETPLPLRHEQDSRGDLKLFGVRYSSFVPRSGLHPTLEAQTPLTLTLRHLNHPTQYVVKLHEWHPEGLAYPGLPTDLNDARERRAARMTVLAQDRPLSTAAPSEAKPVLPRQTPGLTDYCLDLRYQA